MMRLFAIVGMLLFSSYSDTKSGRYANWAEVEREGMIRRGWVPAQLPRDAIAIRVTWDLDINLSEGSHRAPVAIDPSKQNECRPMLRAGNLDCGAFIIRGGDGIYSFSNRLTR